MKDAVVDVKVRIIDNDNGEPVEVRTPPIMHLEVAAVEELNPEAVTAGLLCL